MSKLAKPRLWDRLRKYHENEDGMETIQVVMIIAIGALILIFLVTFLWPEVRQWVVRTWRRLQGNAE